MTMSAATVKTGRRVYKKRCAVCRSPFTASRSNAMYCCQACRQKAARRAKGASPKTAARRRLKTKRATPLGKICAHCGKPFKTTAAASKRLYCRPSCRQAAFRQRKQEAISLLCVVATVEGYSAEVVRKHVSSWPLRKLARALDNAQPAGGLGAAVNYFWATATAAPASISAYS